VRQAAGILGVCTATVYTLCARSQLRHVRILNTIRIDPADLETLIASKSTKGG
jgi:hypothetical protein